MKKIITIGIFAIVALVVVVLGLGGKAPATFGGASFSPVFMSNMVVSATSTVGPTSVTTVVPAGYSQFAEITNNSAAVVWCTLDNAKAASSSAALGMGVKLGAVSTTYSGEIYQSFGAQGNINYVGAINCVSAVSSTLAVVYTKS